ncbi:Heme oxygenase 1, chloroplastic [Dichanthelium oligosanthes]|uniref:heme oxygenase (biliverdin-producing) n=1 Tax=Dichanthelium oligosanthes TaxID=888268 RepID=A0A1E5W3Z6_9POAL|nr:Heme oxygenase 1, chloroplastic [Dichanthelium oligosanthes]
MARAWLSVPRALSLDRAPSSCFRPEPPAARVVPVMVRTATVVVSVAAQRRLVAVAAATKMAPAASGEEPAGKTFIEEMRATAMRMHTRDQSRDGEKEAPLEPPVAKWEPTVEGYLRFLVDIKLVFETLEAVVDRAAVPWYAEFRNTGLERSEALKKDLKWFKQQGHIIPEPSAAGITYASFLEELSEKEPQAFINHFYNLYFGHAAGGRIIGKKVAEKLNLQKELEFYEWEGDLSQLQKNVRDKLNQVASAWSREEKDRCLDEMEKSFICSVDLRRHMFT